MTTLNISLPQNLRAWIDCRIKQGDYNSASDYLRDLIRMDQKQRASLDDMLIVGLESGRAIEITDRFFEKRKNSLKQKIQNKKC